MKHFSYSIEYIIKPLVRISIRTTMSTASRTSSQIIPYSSYPYSITAYTKYSNKPAYKLIPIIRVVAAKQVSGISRLHRT